MTYNFVGIVDAAYVTSPQRIHVKVLVLYLNAGVWKRSRAGQASSVTVQTSEKQKKITSINNRLKGLGGFQRLKTGTFLLFFFLYIQ